MHGYTTGRGQMSADHLLEILAAVGPGEARSFARIAAAVRGRLAQMSSCLLILVEWDDERRALAESLLGGGLELRAMLVCAREDRPREAPAWLHLLHPGEIEAGLARLA